METAPDNTNIEQVEGTAAELPPEAQPRIWVGSLADYNAGVLHGRWLDAARDPDELLDDITWMLVRSPTNPRSEEWGIFDYEGFGPLRLDEYEDIRTVSRIATGIREHGPAFAAWAGEADRDPAALDRFDDAYLGQWESVAAYAEHLLDDLGYADALDAAVPEPMRPYVRFDADALGRDLVLGGDITAVEAPGGGVWLFDPNG